MAKTQLPGEVALEKMHRVLDDMGIPSADPKAKTTRNARTVTGLLFRLRVARQYMDGIRGKAVRLKRRLAAANRALEGERGKEMKQKVAGARDALAFQEEAKRCEAELRKHTVVTHPALWTMPIHKAIAYLVARNNDTQTTIDAQVNIDRATARESKIRAENLEKYNALLKRYLAWYTAHYGPPPPNANAEDLADRLNIQDGFRAGAEVEKKSKFRATGATGYLPLPEHLFREEARQFGKTAHMHELMAEADSYPFKRGNPYYLGDYSLTELLEAVQERVKHGQHLPPNWDNVRQGWKTGANSNTVVTGPLRCGQHYRHQRGNYYCDLSKGHTGLHGETLGGLRTEWNDAGTVDSNNKPAVNDAKKA